MGYYLGLDAGGTKTYCLLCDEQANVLAFGRAGTGNYEVHGVHHAAREIAKAVESVLERSGIKRHDLTGIGLGVAGADLPEDFDMLEREVFAPLFGAIPRAFYNDSMAGLRGGTRQSHGIVIACGTGCVCAGRNRAGEFKRVGGLGREFGDETTGTDIGLQGLQRVWQARDGIIPPTLLTAKFVQRSGLPDTESLFLAMYRGEVGAADLQPMAKLVFDAAYEGDDAAREILERGGRYLGAMVNACAHKLDMANEDFEVVMAGSVFKGTSPVLVDAMRAAIHRACPQANPVMPLFEPVVGALLLALELDHEISDALLAHLDASLRQASAQYNVSFKPE